MGAKIILFNIFFLIFYTTKIHYSDDNYKYTFEITSKKVKERNEKEYYWYKSGKIHRTFGGYYGHLLSGDFTKFYLDNQLAEKGKFNKGLKYGVWKQWYNNGRLKEIILWKNGKKNGKLLLYSKEGELLIEGKFRSNLKHGIWINHKIKDTVYYKKGERIRKRQ